MTESLGALTEAAFAEARAGQPGAASVKLVARAIASKIRTRNFPPPGGGDWDQDRRDDALAQFLHDVDGGAALVNLAVASHDAVHFRRQVLRRVEWWFADASRATPKGRHKRRVVTALERLGDEVVRTDLGWALQQGPDQPGVADEDAVAQALASVHTDPPPKGKSTDVELSPTTPSSYDELVRTALEVSGELSLAALVGLTAERLGVGSDVPSDLDAAAEVVSPSIGALDRIVGREDAEIIWAELTDRQRYVLPHLYETLDAAVEAIGASPGAGGRSSIGAAMKALKESLPAILEGHSDEERTAVMTALLELHAHWFGRRDDLNGQIGAVGRS